MYSYTNGLGDFSTDGYEGKDDETLLWVLFMCLSIFIFLVMLNLLLAIMGDTLKELWSQSNKLECKNNVR